MTTAAERHEFQTEVRQLLDLMIHSLYSHKDVFLRELISNASDALDKLRVEALTRPELTLEAPLAIDLAADPAARTLSVSDNGIGMSRQEVIDNIGTIARSGSREFLRLLRESQGKAAAPELIGQFGVGFYSSFMVADRITLLTRRAGEERGTRWESAGDGYTVEAADRPAAGTTVTLHLKPVNEEEGIADYTAAAVLRELVTRYSDFVAYPIRLGGETLNSMKALWARPRDEVSEEEYREFYRHIAHDRAEPLERLHLHLEGGVEARALLYIPARAPFDLHFRDAPRRGVQLYVRRVFITDDCRELLPPWLRFVRGVVSADDLSLNVSRELLQKDRQIQAIRRHLVRRVLGTLEEMLRERRERYAGFWREFGAVLKEGLLPPEEARERILELLLAPSTHHPSELSTLAEYAGRMPAGQDAIYYLSGDARAVLEASPHLEAFRARGHEVLFFTDPVDELWLQRPPEWQGKRLVSVARGGVGPAAPAEGEGEGGGPDQDERYRDLLLRLRAALQDEVKDVRLSSRLTTSPACLVGEPGDPSPQLLELLRRAGQEVPPVKRVLEVNPGHPLLERLRALAAENAADPRIAEYAALLHDQAVLAEGGQPARPADVARRLAELMLKAL
jgi:molecular chaperone HtpG